MNQKILSTSRKILLLGGTSQDHQLLMNCLEEHTLIHQNHLGDFDETYDLVMIHHRLEESNPLEILERLKQHRYLAGVPCLLIINEGLERMALEGLKKGANAYLTERELIPSILNLVISRAIEQGKWQRIYKVLTESDEQTVLRDPETNLYNAEYFKARVAQEIKRSKRYHFPLTMFVFSIQPLDELLNDFGQDILPLVLKKVGGIIQEDIRSSDLLGRINSQFMALLLPHTGNEQAFIVWERLNNLLASHPLHWEDREIVFSLKGTIRSLSEEDNLDPYTEVKIHS